MLLGLIFVAAGASGFFLLNSPPPMPGLAGAFQDVFFRSRWVLFVDGVEVICGLLLLTNQFVPLALVVLAGVISNILVFHITMMPMGLPPALVVLALWLVVAMNFRSYFASIFVQHAVPDERAGSKAGAQTA